jgi:general secretion pathway protein K
MRLLRDQRGSVLLAVLFLAGLLGIFAAAAGSVMKAAADSSRSFAEGIRGDAAMRSAIEYIVARTGSGLKDAVGSALVDVGPTKVILSVHDEAARIDLNKAPPELIAGIFQQVGVSAETARVYAARIVDWRDDDDDISPNGGAERGAYRAAGRVDGPRNGPFLSVAELALVLGLPSRAAAAVAPYVTVASGRDKVNPLQADPPVLRAMPGMTQERMLDLLEARKKPGIDVASLISRLGPVQDYVTDEAGLAVRFEGRVLLAPNIERRYEAVVAVVEGDNEPYRILAWDANPPGRVQASPQ